MKNSIPGKRLLSIQLNGFNHSVFYDNGSADDEFMIDGYKYENDKIKKEIKRLKKTIKELEQKHDANKALISSFLVDLK